jgi:hypothetical protein
MLRKHVIALALLASVSLAQQSAQPVNSSVGAIDSDLTLKLLNAKRVFVESFGDDAVSKALTAIVLDAIRTSKRFIVTENRERADLILKGTALEKTSQELHALGSATSVAGASGGHSSNVSGSATRVGNVGSASVSGSSAGGFIAHAAGIEDSQASTETIQDARLSVRLVVPDGDVVWSNTQESHGAKFKGATADVADKVVKELVRELDRLNKAKNEPR